MDTLRKCIICGNKESVNDWLAFCNRKSEWNVVGNWNTNIDKYGIADSVTDGVTESYGIWKSNSRRYRVNHLNCFYNADDNDFYNSQ